MALSREDKEEVAEIVATALAQAGIGVRPNPTRPTAEEVLPLIQGPNVHIYPGPPRSRYSYARVCDRDGNVVRRVRVRTSEIRSVLLNSFNEQDSVPVSGERIVIEGEGEQLPAMRSNAPPSE